MSCSATYVSPVPVLIRPDSSLQPLALHPVTTWLACVPVLLRPDSSATRLPAEPGKETAGVPVLLRPDSSLQQLCTDTQISDLYRCGSHNYGKPFFCLSSQGFCVNVLRRVPVLVL